MPKCPFCNQLIEDKEAGEDVLSDLHPCGACSKNKNSSQLQNESVSKQKIEE